MSFKSFLSSLGCLVIALSLVAATRSPDSVKPIHCYALLSPVTGIIEGSSQILETACFDTVAQAIEAATHRRINLDPSISPEDVTDAMLNGGEGANTPVTQVVIGIDWDYTYFGGSSYTWVANDYGCSSSIQYGVTTMPSGWDNRVSSARGFSNCNYYYHYQNTAYGGTSIACHTECASMGTLDNDTSSERWTVTQ